jgi:E3 ubiquitin-protein ligase RAD18
MVKDGPLKKKLMDQGLSAAGSRQMLERRYSEWITLWNSNCDARIPKGKNELRRELDVWERTQGGRAQASGSMNPGAQIREKDFDGQAWATKHDDSFRDLIAAARRKLPPKATPALAPPDLEPAEPTSPGPEYISPYETPLEPSNSTNPNIGAMAQDQIPVLSQPLPQASLNKPDGSQQRRFFDEGTNGNPTIPTSTQYLHQMPVLENDAGIASDITTMRTVQS